MRRKIAIFTLMSALFALGSVSAATTRAPADVTGVDRDARLIAYMSGAAESPGPGDPDGVGRAYVTIDDSADQLCLYLQFTNVTLPATGLHIHVAPPGSPGPIVVPFTPPSTNQLSQCVSGSEALLDDIATNPQKYYINIHTQPGFGAGAIRGQLQSA